jgi:hypothetical protein
LSIRKLTGTTSGTCCSQSISSGAQRSTEKQRISRPKSFPGEAVEKERRAGLLTTKYYLTLNTMFTPLPRTAAAQAYRAFLGFELSLSEGLRPVANEPVDYDRKGVQAAECAGCHSTLDALSYPFSRYDGVSGPDFYDREPTYLPNRLPRFYEASIPGVDRMPERGVLLGAPVADLTQWVQVATQSEAFARSRVSDYWTVFFHRKPSSKDSKLFNELIKNLMGKHNYSLDAMLEELVQSLEYGMP